jgi:hypothetical protein
LKKSTGKFYKDQRKEVAAKNTALRLPCGAYSLPLKALKRLDNWLRVYIFINLLILKRLTFSCPINTTKLSLKIESPSFIFQPWFKELLPGRF